MEFIQSFGSVAATIIAAVGAIGGLWSLYDRWCEWRRFRRPHGLRDVSTFCVGRTDTPEKIECDFLVVGDLIRIMRPFVEPPLCGKLKALERVGDYYHFSVVFPPGTDLHLVRSGK